jgi:hypothetical protein
MNGYNCRSCGANLNPSQSTCDYCGSPYQEVSVVSIDVGVDFDEELRGLKFITEHPLFPTLASFMRASGSWSYLILDHLKLLDEALSKIRTIDRHKFPILFSDAIEGLAGEWENFAMDPSFTDDDTTSGVTGPACLATARISRTIRSVT